MVRLSKTEGSALCLVLTLILTLAGVVPLPVRAQEKARVRPSVILHTAGLRDRVTVRRDERGIPYIEAANEADLYFAQGYVTASDRLWQMDLMRRTARGELSELFGRATLEQDKQYRVFGFAAICEALVTRLTPRVRAQFEAYSRGVNAFIDSREPNSLPLEFRLLQYAPHPWSPADSLIIGKLMAESLSTSWQWDIMRASRSDLPREMREALSMKTSIWDVPIVGSDAVDKRARSSLVRADEPLHESKVSARLFNFQSSIAETTRRSLEFADMYTPRMAASNNWVVSGKRTASGKPLLANDPHLVPSAPSIWYMTLLSLPGLRVAGVTFPGAPGIIIGHNERIAWGMTNLGADVQDLYMEKFDKENSQTYWTPSGRRQAETRRERIKVRKVLNDPLTEIVNFEVTVTSHGPIVFERDSVKYALRWSALDSQASELAAFYAINRARNWKEFCAALRDFPGPAQNFIYADSAGHIGYYGAGKIPIRRTGDGSVPYDGAKDAGDWIGFIPFDGLPHVYDPPSGVIVTANNRIIGRDYPYHLSSDWAPPYRARRILDLLQAKPKLTVEDFRTIQSDTYSISGLAFAREFIRVTNPSAQAVKDNNWTETIELLRGWDGYVNASSRAPAILAEIRVAFRRRVLSSVLGPGRAEQAAGDISNTLFDYLITKQPPEWLPKEFANYGELLRACEKDAREVLTKRLGPDRSQWTWGRISVARFSHPLAGVPNVGEKFIVPVFPVSGSGGNFPTVNVGSSVSMRLIADLGSWDNTQQGIALGQSGDPSSEHWLDQLNDWKSVATRVFPFTKWAVENATRQTVELAPQPR